MTQVKLYLDQLDNGWVIRDESDAQNIATEIVKDKNVRYHIGKWIMSEVIEAMNEAILNGCELEINIKPVESRLNKNVKA